MNTRRYLLPFTRAPCGRSRGHHLDERGITPTGMPVPVLQRQRLAQPKARFRQQRPQQAVPDPAAPLARRAVHPGTHVADRGDLPRRQHRGRDPPGYADPDHRPAGPAAGPRAPASEGKQPASRGPAARGPRPASPRSARGTGSRRSQHSAGSRSSTRRTGDGLATIEVTSGPSPERSQARNDPTCASHTRSQPSPNTARYDHHSASARAYDLTVFGEVPWTRRYSRNSSAGPITRWSQPSTVHVAAPPGSTSRCVRHSPSPIVT